MYLYLPHQQEVRERSNQDGKLIKMSICVDATQICERAPLPIFHSNHGLIQFLSNGTISTMVVKASATFLEAGLLFLHTIIVQSLHSARCDKKPPFCLFLTLCGHFFGFGQHQWFPDYWIESFFWIESTEFILNNSFKWILGKQYWIEYWIESFFGKIQRLNWIVSPAPMSVGIFGPTA